MRRVPVDKVRTRSKFLDVAYRVKDDRNCASMSGDAGVEVLATDLALTYIVNNLNGIEDGVRTARRWTG